MKTLLMMVLLAQEPSQLRSAVQAEQSQDIRHRTCQLERSLSRPPFHCYLESMATAAINELDRECIARIRTVTDLYLSVADEAKLSPRCRQAVAERALDLHYVAAANALR